MAGYGTTAAYRAEFERLRLLGLKLCRACSTIKPHAEFFKATRSRDGLGSYCKGCSSASTKKYRTDNLGYFQQFDKDWKQKNPWQRRTNEVNHLTKRRMKQAGYGHLYMPIASVEVVWDRDGGSCGYCHTPVDLSLCGTRNPMRLSFDHYPVGITIGGLNTEDNLRVTHVRCNSLSQEEQKRNAG